MKMKNKNIKEKIVMIVKAAMIQKQVESISG
jgi:hypothetical protein